MKTYIALLRGINVSGQKKIKMANLRKQLAELHWKNIRSYIQSGNIIFETAELGRETLEKQLQNKIEEHYGFQVPVLIKTAAELEHALENNPHLKDPTKDEDKAYFTFLKKNPEQANIDKVATYDYSPEEYIIDDKCIYVYPPNGYGRAKMNNNFFEDKLQVDATTRNLKSVRVLLAMAKNKTA